MLIARPYLATLDISSKCTYQNLYKLDAHTMHMKVSHNKVKDTHGGEHVNNLRDLK